MAFSALSWLCCWQKQGSLCKSVSGVAAIIDQEKKVKHSRFSEKIEQAIQDPQACQVRLKAENLDSAYPPLVQSGGVYELKLGTQSDDRPIHFDVVRAPFITALLLPALTGSPAGSCCANFNERVEHYASFVCLMLV